MPTAIGDRDRLIVALDVPTVRTRARLVATLGDAVTFYKVGHAAPIRAGGMDYVRELLDAGKRVFLDAKLFDIGETIERAVENVARMGVDSSPSTPTRRPARRGGGARFQQAASCWR
jgi:orotidine-5'-phosphate decarboxylase